MRESVVRSCSSRIESAAPARPIMQRRSVALPRVRAVTLYAGLHEREPPVQYPSNASTPQRSTCAVVERLRRPSNALGLCPPRLVVMASTSRVCARCASFCSRSVVTHEETREKINSDGTAHTAHTQQSDTACAPCLPSTMVPLSRYPEASPFALVLVTLCGPRRCGVISYTVVGRLDC